LYGLEKGTCEITLLLHDCYKNEKPDCAVHIVTGGRNVCQFILPHIV